MKLQITIEDRHGGIDVTCIGVATDGFPNDGDSLANLVTASLLFHLRRVWRLNAVTVTEGGGKPTWVE